tara:strand:- start:223 stop:384 length:162 start_codon:yes stop_codon:yes gene_type:complete
MILIEIRLLNLSFLIVWDKTKASSMEEGDIRGEITRKHIKKLNEEEMKKNADT